MGKHDKGKPSGIDKEEGLGLRPEISPEDMEQDKEMTEKYTDGADKLSDSVREMKPNRNTDKTDATNAGGYKN